MQSFLKREGRRSFVQSLIVNFLFYVLGVATTVVLGVLQSHA